MCSRGATDDNTPCWVYVLRIGGGAYRVCYSLELPANNRVRSLIWLRRFRGVANAMAYKLLLESLSYTTLKYLVEGVPRSGGRRE